MGKEGGDFEFITHPPAQDDLGANDTRLQLHRWLHTESLVVRLVPESQIKSSECYLGVTKDYFLSYFF